MDTFIPLPGMLASPKWQMQRGSTPLGQPGQLPRPNWSWPDPLRKREDFHSVKYKHKMHELRKISGK